jgi:hypothetical protein
VNACNGTCHHFRFRVLIKQPVTIVTGFPLVYSHSSPLDTRFSPPCDRFLHLYLLVDCLPAELFDGLAKPPIAFCL